MRTSRRQIYFGSLAASTDPLARTRPPRRRRGGGGEEEEEGGAAGPPSRGRAVRPQGEEGPGRGQRRLPGRGLPPGLFPRVAPPRRPPAQPRLRPLPRRP